MYIHCCTSKKDDKSTMMYWVFHKIVPHAILCLPTDNGRNGCQKWEANSRRLYIHILQSVTVQEYQGIANLLIVINKYEKKQQCNYSF